MGLSRAAGPRPRHRPGAGRASCVQGLTVRACRRTGRRAGRCQVTATLAFVTTWPARWVLAVRLYGMHRAEHETRGPARGAPLLMAKIKVEGAVVELDGDEMTRI